MLHARLKSTHVEKVGHCVQADIDGAPTRIVWKRTEQAARELLVKWAIEFEDRGMLVEFS
jgi:hypothetical protein